jgi:hypothetical protein
VLTTYGTLAAEFKSKEPEGKSKTKSVPKPKTTKPSLLASIHWWRVVLDEGRANQAHLKIALASCEDLSCLTLTHTLIRDSPPDQEQEDEDRYGRSSAQGRAPLVPQRHPHPEQVNSLSSWLHAAR